MTTRTDTLLCAGGAQVRVEFTSGGGEPLKGRGFLSWRERPFPETLAAHILDPFLDRWSTETGDRRPEVREDLNRAMDACVAAFREAGPEDAREDGAAVLVALTVTANLQRTLIFLAEHLIRPAQPGATPVVATLSRAWCGFVPGRKRPPMGGPSYLRPLGRALGCAPAEVDAHCREALSRLRADLRRGAVLAQEDLAQYGA